MKTILILISFLTNALIIYFSPFILKRYRYSGVQSIHEGKITRLGGISIYLGLLSSILIVPSFTFNFLSKMSFALLPLFMVSLREDLKHDVTPMYRLTVAALSAFVMIHFFGTIKNIDIPFLSSIFHSNTFLLLLTLLAFTAITHGFNMIDGLNGLTVLTYWAIMGSIYSMSLSSHDVMFHEITLIASCLPLGFFVFNYPFGKIFLGDTGAYLLGFISSAIIIYFFNQNPQLLSWQAILIFIYPITEVIYTFVRRLTKKLSPFKPDNKHLHTFFYQMLKRKKLFSKQANNYATLCMLPFILYGPLVNQMVKPIPEHIFLATLFYVVAYILTYRNIK